MKLIKTLAVGILLTGTMGVLVANVPSATEVIQVKPQTSASSTEAVVEVEEDVIEKANRELERINNELDAEETRLLEERNAIDARLEQIRETRTSF